MDEPAVTLSPVGSDAVGESGFRTHSAATPPAGPRRRPAKKGVGVLKRLGPGLITGASDDDPSGIATYSQAGAQFGYGLLWTMLFSLPLMVRHPGDQRPDRPQSPAGASPATSAGTTRPGCSTRSSSCWSSPTPSTSGPTSARWATPCALLIGGPALLYCRRLRRRLPRCSRSSPQYDRYCQVPEVADARPVQLRRHRLHGPRPLGRGAEGDRRPLRSSRAATTGRRSSPSSAPPSARTCSSGRRRRRREEIRANPDEQPLLKATRSRPAEQFRRIRWTPTSGMAFSNLGRLLHHPVGRRHAARPRRDRHPDLGPGRRGAAAAGGAADVRAVRAGDRRHRPAGGAGAGRVGGVRGRRGAASGRCGLDRKPLDAKGFYGVLAAATLLGLAINFPAVQQLHAPHPRSRRCSGRRSSTASSPCRSWS